MDVTSSTGLQAMGVSADDAVDAVLLKKALNLQAASMAQLLETMPTPPQAEGKGTVVDAQV